MGFLLLPLQVLFLLAVVIYSPIILYKAIRATIEQIGDPVTLILALAIWSPVIVTVWFIYDCVAFSEGWPRFP